MRQLRLLLLLLLLAVAAAASPGVGGDLQSRWPSCSPLVCACFSSRTNGSNSSKEEGEVEANCSGRGLVSLTHFFLKKNFL